MTVVVDPFLLELPTGPDVTADVIRQYAGRLIKWSDTFRKNPDYVVSGYAIIQMSEIGLIPDTNNLSRLFEKYEIDDYSANDIAIGCQTVMENFPQMEDRSNSMDITCQEQNKRIIPDEIRQRMHPQVADAFCTALIAASYSIIVLAEEDEWSLATAPLNGYSEITVSGEIEDKAKISVEKIWPLLFDPEIFEEMVSIQDKIFNIFQKDPMEALRICWEDIGRKDGGVGEITSFRIHFVDQFIPSVIKSANQQDTIKKDIQRIFVGITYAINDLWKFGCDKHHALRKSIQVRASLQQTRNRGGLVDRAARVEIKGGPLPLRLHYWICGDGSYEISNLTNNHNDATIYY